MKFPTYYSRQIRLSEVGIEGQERLKNAKCLVIGAGGLGSPVLLYLAAAGIGQIGICDGDRVDESNLHRQPIYSTHDIGKSKAETSAEKLRDLNPLIDVSAYPFHLTAQNASPLFSKFDLILDCTDNFRTKFLINDAAYFLKKPVIRASIYQFEGQIQTYLPSRGDACLRCLWEEVPEEGCVGTCQEVGVLGPIPGYFGIMQAMEAIKFFLKLPHLASNEILFSDLIHYNQSKISFEARDECPLCGKNPTIHGLIEKQTWEISAEELKKMSYKLIDIREMSEVEKAPYLKGPYFHMPMSAFDQESLNSDTRYALFCHKGRRSQSLVRALRESGHTNVYSIIGGILSLR